MTGQDFQDRFDALLDDLQKAPADRAAHILFRSADGTPQVFPITKAGQVINPAQVAAAQAFIDTLKPIADTYEAEFTPVRGLSETFRLARAVHQPLIDAAQTARIALQTALEADADYQAADTALRNAQTDPDYIVARTAYQNNNVSENFGNLSDARGKYTEV